MGKFCIHGRPRASACFRAKERLMRVIFGKTTNKHVKTAAELPENEENLKGLSFRWTPDLLRGLGNHCFERRSWESSALLHRETQRAYSERVGEQVH